MRDGKLVPQETVQSVLEESLVSSVRGGKSDILLDGFPRSMEQTKLFEASVSAERLSRRAVRAVGKIADKRVGFQDQGSAMVPGLQGDFASRVLNRGKTSGRVDDKEAVFEKRYQGFLDESEEIIRYFEQEKKLFKVMIRRLIQYQEGRC